MPNFANVLKTEVARIVRKELRSELQATKKMVSSHRAQIAQLKRHVNALEQQLKSVFKESKRKVGIPEEGDVLSFRFSSKGLVSQRKRLGLSVVAAAKILGVSPQSVANWESGKTRPREAQISAIAALRKMGKREATARLTA